MQIFPAIDLRGGQVVRLYQGDYDKETVYAQDPCAVARDFIAAGAGYLHVVDLDGAKDGTLANFDTIAAIAGQGGLYIEVGGGIRDEDRIRRRAAQVRVANHPDDGQHVQDDQQHHNHGERGLQFRSPQLVKQFAHFNLVFLYIQRLVRRYGKRAIHAHDQSL